MRLACWCAALAVTAAVAEDAPEPFQSLEDLSSPESQAFYRGEATRARSALDALPGRGAMLARIRALSDSAPLVTNVKLGGRRVFYLKAASREAPPVLCVRDGLGGAERVLIEPRGALEWYSPSPDGGHVAYGTAEGGDVVLRVFDVEARRVLAGEIDRA